MNKSQIIFAAIIFASGIATLGTAVTIKPYCFSPRELEVLKIASRNQDPALPPPAPIKYPNSKPPGPVAPTIPEPDFNPATFPLLTEKPTTSSYGFREVSESFLMPALPKDDFIKATDKYRDDKFRFEFQYPSRLSFKNSPDIVDTFYIGMIYPSSLYPKDSSLKLAYANNIEIYPTGLYIQKSSSMRIEDVKYIRYENIENVARLDMQRFTLAGQPALRVLVYLKGNGSPRIEFFHVIKEGYLYTYATIAGEDIERGEDPEGDSINPLSLDQFEAIRDYFLNTFRFL